MQEIQTELIPHIQTCYSGALNFLFILITFTDTPINSSKVNFTIKKKLNDTVKINSLDDYFHVILWILS